MLVSLRSTDCYADARRAKESLFIAPCADANCGGRRRSPQTVLSVIGDLEDLGTKSLQWLREHPSPTSPFECSETLLSLDACLADRILCPPSVGAREMSSLYAPASKQAMVSSDAAAAGDAEDADDCAEGVTERRLADDRLPGLTLRQIEPLLQPNRALHPLHSVQHLQAAFSHLGAARPPPPWPPVVTAIRELCFRPNWRSLAVGDAPPRIGSAMNRLGRLQRFARRLTNRNTTTMRMATTTPCVPQEAMCMETPLISVDAPTAAYRTSGNINFGEPFVFTQPQLVRQLDQCSRLIGSTCRRLRALAAQLRQATLQRMHQLIKAVMTPPDADTEPSRRKWPRATSK